MIGRKLGRRDLLGAAPALLLALVHTGPRAEAAGGLLFGYLERPLPQPALARRLSCVLARKRRQEEEPDLAIRTGLVTRAGLERWEAAQAAVASLGFKATMQRVNERVNALPYVTDQALYGVRDRWSTPQELFSRGGDCECMALAKAVLLVGSHAVAPERLRLVILAPTPLRDAHAILAVADDRDFLILDNRTPAILPSAAITDATPLAGLGPSGQFAYERASGPHVTS